MQFATIVLTTGAVALMFAAATEGLAYGNSALRCDQILGGVCKVPDRKQGCFIHGGAVGTPSVVTGCKSNEVCCRVPLCIDSDEVPGAECKPAGGAYCPGNTWWKAATGCQPGTQQCCGTEARR